MPTLNQSRKDREREQRLQLLKVAQAEALAVFYEARRRNTWLQIILDDFARAIAERDKDDG